MSFKFSPVLLVTGLCVGIGIAGYAVMTRADAGRPADDLRYSMLQGGAPPEMKEGVRPDTPANQALLKAVRALDLKAVRAAFAQGADPNAKLVYFAPDGTTPQNTTPLLGMVNPRQADNSDLPTAIAVFHEFLSHKPDMTMTTTDGRNAVFWALWLEDVGVLRAVLDAGADPNAEYRFPLGGGNTVHMACSLILRGREEKGLPLVRLVLERGGNPNAYNSQGMTPLHSQSLSGNPGCVALLLEFGADPSLTSKGEKISRPPGGGIPVGWTPLQFARRGGNDAVVNLLLAARTKGGGVLSPTEAATVGDVNALKEHLKTGMDPRGKAEDGTPFIILATVSGKEEAVRLLLDKGADPNVVGPYQSTALLRASALGYDRIVRLLLAHNANPNWAQIRDTKFPQPDTALLAAIRAAEPEVVTTLAASKRLDWNAPGNRDALYMAVMNAGQIPSRPIGKDPSQRKRGDALLAAREQIYKLVVAHIDMRKYGGTALAAAADAGQFGLAEDLLRRGANPNGRGRDGTSVLIATIHSIGMVRDDSSMMDTEELSPRERKQQDREIAERDKAGMAFLRLLLARRPDMNAATSSVSPTEETETALSAARLWKLKDVELLLKKAGAKR